MSIVVKNVCKRYGDTIALDNVSLKLEEGVIYGLLGPNGSGKSTLMKIMLGLVERDSGKVSILGYDPIINPIEVRKITGYVPETPVLSESMSIREFFNLIASIRRLDRKLYEERVNKLVNVFGLSDRVDDFIGSLSRGNKQKVLIIAALLHEPKILIMDEPLTGLDPISAKILKDYIRELAKRGSTILLSTHILELAEIVCDYIIIMYNGRILAEGNIEELREKVSSNANLEEVFLKITHTDTLVEELVKTLRE